MPETMDQVKQSEVSKPAEEDVMESAELERFKSVPEHSGSIQQIIDRYGDNPAECPYIRSMGAAGVELVQKLAAEEQNPDRGPTIREMMEAKKARPTYQDDYRTKTSQKIEVKTTETTILRDENRSVNEARSLDEKQPEQIHSFESQQVERSVQEHHLFENALHEHQQQADDKQKIIMERSSPVITTELLKPEEPDSTEDNNTEMSNTAMLDKRAFTKILDKTDQRVDNEPSKPQEIQITTPPISIESSVNLNTPPTSITVESPSSEHLETVEVELIDNTDKNTQNLDSVVDDDYVIENLVVEPRQETEDTIGKPTLEEELVLDMQEATYPATEFYENLNEVLQPLAKMLEPNKMEEVQYLLQELNSAYKENMLVGRGEAIDEAIETQQETEPQETLRKLIELFKTLGLAEEATAIQNIFDKTSLEQTNRASAKDNIMFIDAFRHQGTYERRVLSTRRVLHDLSKILRQKVLQLASLGKYALNFATNN